MKFVPGINLGHYLVFTCEVHDSGNESTYIDIDI